LRNLLKTGECVINLISEGIIEAVNSTSINAPYGVSEWVCVCVCVCVSLFNGRRP
jgi:flavin reductase (DIM6/NTAB) family NADH-FMN oxidoreductase RutF